MPMKEKNNMQHAPELSITDADRELVKMLADGKSAKDIAKSKKINYNTFAFNLTILKSKCGSLNTNNLIAYFLRNKLID